MPHCSTALLLIHLLAQLITKASYAQQPNLIAKLGISIAYGTHIQKCGILMGIGIQYKQLQANTILHTQYNFKHLGPPQAHWSASVHQGIAYGWQPRLANIESINNIDAHSLQQAYNYKIAYALHWYSDTRNTTQRTASIALRMHHYIISTDNDALAFSSWDRYRTGNIHFAYTNALIQVGTQVWLWTGQSNKLPVLTDTLNGRSRRYVNLQQAQHGQYSHGILQLYSSYNLPMQQSVSAHVGIDAEQVRNIIQNKVVHQAWLLKILNPKVQQAIIPMLDEQQKPVTNKLTQHIKKPILFAQLASNTISWE
jgi:hypothetical protein